MKYLTTTNQAAFALDNQSEVSTKKCPVAMEKPLPLRHFCFQQLSGMQASASRHEAEALRWASTAEQLKSQLESRDARERVAESKVGELEKKFKQVLFH